MVQFNNSSRAPLINLEPRLFASNTSHQLCPKYTIMFVLSLDHNGMAEFRTSCKYIVSSLQESMKFGQGKHQCIRVQVCFRHRTDGINAIYAAFRAESSEAYQTVLMVFERHICVWLITVGFITLPT